nr:MAG TPA: hypothetical protein [Caudoviricetes sp.]
MLTDKDFSDFQVIYVTNSNLQPVSAFLLRLNFFSCEPKCQRTNQCARSKYSLR